LGCRFVQDVDTESNLGEPYGAMGNLRGGGFGGNANGRR
jgi:hypothetical protein